MSDILRRRIVRVAFSVRGPLAGCHPPALLGSLTAVFARAGLGVAMGSEKRPRPMARLAYPLPLGVEGLEELADVTLEAPEAGPPGAPDAAALRAHCREGMDILRIERVPHHASPIDELVETAHWAWSCPGGLLGGAAEKLKEFERAESFALTKTGKLDGRKGTKSVDVRPLVLSMAWEGGDLLFTTSIVQGHALNPQKLLAAVLGVGAEGLGGPGALRRLRMGARADPRLPRHDKYAHKLRNLYEDAVLLESGHGAAAPGGYGGGDEGYGDDGDDDAVLSL
jgi:hypothetical protein